MLGKSICGVLASGYGNTLTVLSTSRGSFPST